MVKRKLRYVSLQQKPSCTFWGTEVHMYGVCYIVSCFLCQLFKKETRLSVAACFFVSGIIQVLWTRGGEGGGGGGGGDGVQTCYIISHMLYN